MPVELIVVLFVVAMLIVLVLALARGTRFHSRGGKISCVHNLKQVALAAKIWAGDNNDTLPMGISITNGGSMEDALAGRVLSTFLVMSNELSTPKILICPSDHERRLTNNFAGLSAANVSYFVGIDDTNDINPQSLRFGERHLELSGRPVRPGLAVFATNDAVAWSRALMHKNFGYISLGDGSVQGTPSKGLPNFFQQTGIATNRLAMP